VTLFLHDAEVDGARCDVTIAGGVIRDVAGVSRLAEDAGAEVIDAAGGALLPGLHDHHVHLLAMAAADASVVAGPPAILDGGALGAALRAEHTKLPAGAWIRAVGYHDSVAGPIDREWLDALGIPRPIRVQHRSGALWILSSAALAALPTASSPLELDASGRPTGRLYRHDDWLRDHVPHRALDLAAVGRRLLGFGVTGVTDLTPTTAVADLDTLAAADLDVRVTVTGAASLPESARPGLSRGPVKVVIDDHDLPPLEWIADQFRAARRARRAVAVHCVSRVALVLALAAWDEVGAVEGDRIEHGAVIPLELIGDIRDLGLIVVTQPNFVAERGDEYLADVEPDDRPDLWRCGTLIDAGVGVAFGSDAPYGDPDPWALIAAATQRRSRLGAPVGPSERIGAADALRRMLGGPTDPTRPRRVAPGAVADLCLLDRPLGEQLTAPTASAVRATIVGGRIS